MDQDFIGLDLKQNEPMVIIIEVTNFTVTKVSKFEIRPYHHQLVRFSGERLDTRGYINLLITFEDPHAPHDLRSLSCGGGQHILKHPN
ncbi:hypothetical protein CR513_61696, partial [Mucuna pruriens]